MSQQNQQKSPLPNPDGNKNSPNPKHIAIIMDGNGRWAKENGVPRVEGHRKGAEAVRKTVKACLNIGIEFLTIYAFSSENWSRPMDEVNALMGLLRLYIANEVSELHKKNVKIVFMGDKSPFADDIKAMIKKTEEKTKNNTRLKLIIALNYGGREEILKATQNIAKKAISGDIKLDDFSEKDFSKELYTAEYPDPDLIIRTSGEQRLSNFLLWQCAYSEFVFLDEYWPEFNEAHLEKALEIYKSRERRFGGRK